MGEETRGGREPESRQVKSQQLGQVSGVPKPHFSHSLNSGADHSDAEASPQPSALAPYQGAGGGGSEEMVPWASVACSLPWVLLQVGWAAPQARVSGFLSPRPSQPPVAAGESALVCFRPLPPDQA